jgi:hypothetical protein
LDIWPNKIFISFLEVENNSEMSFLPLSSTPLHFFSFSFASDPDLACEQQQRTQQRQGGEGEATAREQSSNGGAEVVLVP